MEDIKKKVIQIICEQLSVSEEDVVPRPPLWTTWVPTPWIWLR